MCGRYDTSSFEARSDCCECRDAEETDVNNGNKIYTNYFKYDESQYTLDYQKVDGLDLSIRFGKKNYCNIGTYDECEIVQTTDINTYFYNNDKYGSLDYRSKEYACTNCRRGPSWGTTCMMRFNVESQTAEEYYCLPDWICKLSNNPERSRYFRPKMDSNGYAYLCPYGSYLGPKRLKPWMIVVIILVGLIIISAVALVLRN